MKQHVLTVGLLGLAGPGLARESGALPLSLLIFLWDIPSTKSLAYFIYTDLFARVNPIIDFNRAYQLLQL
jgi:hypothetical protein